MAPHVKINISKEPYPIEQPEINDPMLTLNRISSISYSSLNGLDLVEIRRAGRYDQTWYSPDNGKSWVLIDEMHKEDKLGNELSINRNLGPLIYDRYNCILIRFLSEVLVNEKFFDTVTLGGYKNRAKHIASNSVKYYYQLSHDNGKSWHSKMQLIQNGPQYNSDCWAEGVAYGKNGLYIEGTHQLPDLDGDSILLPVGIRTSVNADIYGTIQASHLSGVWNEVKKDYDWSLKGKVPGGGTEQTVIRMKDKRLLNILRAQGLVKPYFFSPHLRPYTISENEGNTWRKPEPLKFDDGSFLVSSLSMSKIIRASQNGKLYWIGTILPHQNGMEQTTENPASCDPRYPLYIVEFDEDGLFLKKKTMTVIEDRAPEESKWVRFSNFQTYEDRESKEICIIMTKHYSESEKDRNNLPFPGFKYKIKLTEVCR